MNLRAKFFFATGWLGLLVLTLPGSALANPIGTGAITNCTPGGGVTISNLMDIPPSILWLPVAGANLGCIATGLPTSISYSGGTFTSGTGTISDVPGSSNPFLVLAGGVLDFSLTSVAAPTPTDGVCSTSVALASGHSCVAFFGSPFLLLSQGTSTVLTLAINGVVTDEGNLSTSPYTGLFSSPFSSTTAAIASTIDQGGSITSTYSATLALGSGPAVPEPSTLAFLNVGLALVGIGRKRFGKRQHS